MERKRTALSEKNLRESHVSEGTALPRFLRMSEHALTVLDFHRASVSWKALLEDDGGVSTFRVAGRAEGGAGVTVASFG